uniref:PDZ domain-containing protein n=1 Tax=Acrobeloides nanus TaxID=290746 RepID=A0A914E6B6_9BILA
MEIKLKKSKNEEAYGFSISTTESSVHFARGILENGIASKNGLKDGDCILAVNKVTIHMQLNNQEATLLIKQHPKKVHLTILKKADYELRSLLRQK